MKKVISLLLCVVLLLSLAVTGSAETTGATIIITGSAEGSIFYAFKIMDATVADGGGAYSYTVLDKYIETIAKACKIDLMKEDESDDDGKEIFKTPSELSEEIVEYMTEHYQTNSPEMNNVAVKLHELVHEDENIKPDYTNMPAEGETNIENKLENVAPGYYLIVEKEVGGTTTDKSDTRSLYMLHTVGNENLTIATKESVPTVEKTVATNEGATDQPGFAEHADHDLNDEFLFKIVGTVSSRYDSYQNYYFEFSDTMSGGLALAMDKTNNEPENMAIYIGQTEVTEYFNIDLFEPDVSGHVRGFTATANLKTLAKESGVTIVGESEVVMYYLGTLVKDSLVAGGAGNPNKVQLKYQRDPYATEDPDDEINPPGVTPEDTAIVFTFNGKITKKGQDKDGKAIDVLKGATFELEKFDVDTNTWNTVGKITNNDGNIFEFKGLDAGTYKLTETAPQGFYPIAPFEFKVVPEYDTTNEPAELTSLKITDKDGDDIYEALKINFDISSDNGTFETTVVNRAGAEMPSTGGMGTTILYIAGSVLVLAAIVLLVTKKRMSSAE